MFFRRLLTASVVFASASLLSCKAQEPVLPNASAIEVRGAIEIFPGGYGAASIRTMEGECYDLALPKDALQKHRRWNKGDVLVSGTLVVRPRLPDAAWFDIRDRRIEAGGCSDYVIYVESLTDSKGERVINPIP